LVDPYTRNNKMATYHSWFAIPLSRNERMPRYLHLDLSRHVMRNISRFRLRAHTLKVEAAAWLEDGSCVRDQCPGEDEHVQNEVHALLICQDHRVCELRKLFSFLFTPYLRTFQQPNPFCCNRLTTNLFMISFLSRTIEFFFFFLSLWIYLWLAETSQQPISQTTWLKVTPHCNHCICGGSSLVHVNFLFERGSCWVGVTMTASGLLNLHRCCALRSDGKSQVEAIPICGLAGHVMPCRTTAGVPLQLAAGLNTQRTFLRQGICTQKVTGSTIRAKLYHHYN